MEASDTYLTISNDVQAVFRDKGSRFLAYAYNVSSEAEIKEHLDALRKKYYDATHHCYAWRLGPQGEYFRANDDGEPSGTAGKPILGQLLSKNLTFVLVVVVRYFGGTKLGVPGLINAYRESTKDVLEVAEITERIVETIYEIRFPYLSMNDVMKIVKDTAPRIIEQAFDNDCRMLLAIRRSMSENLLARLQKVESIQVETI